MEIKDLGKPANKWCPHFAVGRRCTIYSTRPNDCRVFQCGWTTNPVLGEEWRPDRCHFVMCVYQTGELVIVTDQSYPDHWRKEPFYSRIKFWAKRGPDSFPSVYVHRLGHSLVVFPECEIDLGVFRAGVTVLSGYRRENGKLVPYAYYDQGSG